MPEQVTDKVEAIPSRTNEIPGFSVKTTLSQVLCSYLSSYPTIKDEPSRLHGHPVGVTRFRQATPTTVVKLWLPRGAQLRVDYDARRMQ